MLDGRAPFSVMNIHPALKQGLIDSAHYRSTPIQEQAIIHFFHNDPLILFSPSGTGKTCAFSILMLELIARKYFDKQWERPPSVIKGGILGLILVHSPELSQQVAKELQSISRHLPLSIFPIISSIKLEEDWEEINTANIVVATPGIVAKLLSKKKLKLYYLMSIVIDEWDKMLNDDGLNHNISQILQRPMPEIKQHICASATISQEAYSKLIKLLPFQWSLLRSTIIDNSGRKCINMICRAGSFNKRVNTIIEMFRLVEFHQALIFCNIHQLSKGAEEALNEAGFPCAFISSQMDQRERLDRIAEFRDLQLRCLITTDIAARGLDILNVNLVISLDFPYDNETFLHRIGRAGRFMTNQVSLTFYKRSESKKITQLHQTLGIDFSIYDKNHPVKFSLPLLENELHIQNYLKLVQIAEKVREDEENAEKDKNVIPMMFYCEKDNEYWDNYHDICQKYKPPF
ncbi:Eukaryotic initiation factor 4A [Tritrichomonas foetus]|uniref:Eukaryotic initiation factor 4A n=1 Tax=Tritrichomonas foetus TaxID=1144522 RepID=A0A1J4KM97_9EUKA|nr:Eukaryotic initiation factor 4A [Tritrichomonas foetus]|eukprot:OHT12425.1 Eukaryotic initiation factor 4A [Tritrichomonas foetus]